MYTGMHWLNSNQTGDKQYLNATNLNRIERAIEGAIGKKWIYPIIGQLTQKR